MTRFSLIFLLFFLFCQVKSQVPVGTWSDHLVYNTAKAVAVGSEDVFASTGSSIIVYNKQLAELRKLSRINGLSETGISAIAWSEEHKALIISYTTANVDILIDNTVYNLPDIARKYLPGKKTINRIRTSGKNAFLACSFGIIVIDLERKEILDTWKPGTNTSNPEVLDITFGNGKIYAATSSGVYEGDLKNSGLSYFGNWKLLDYLPVPNGKYTNIVHTGSGLFVNLSDPLSGGDAIYKISSGSTLLSFTAGIFNNSIDPGTDGFTVSSQNSIKYYDQNGLLLRNISSYGWGSLNISQGIADNGNMWIADINNGLVSGETMSVFTSLTLPGPVSNNAWHIFSHNGKTAISGGGTTTSWNSQRRPFQVSLFENNNWSSLTSATIYDALRTYIDPADNNHIFVSAWGGGLLEYKDNILVNQFTESNSPLQTIIPGGAYVRVCGLAMDKAGNLWLTQTEVPGSIKVLTPEGNWIVNPVTINAPTIGDIIIAGSGYKWIVLPRGHGLFILDDNNSPSNFTDDRSSKLTIRNSNDEIVSNVQCVAEDLDGNIWTGTDQGPFIFYNPGMSFGEGLVAYRIKIPRNDGTGLADYMLDNETITTIAIDGANRKWLGTAGSGVYLLSQDGTEELQHFTEENSPLFSNSIVSIAVDDKTGEVWFGTSKGVQSLRGNAIQGGEEFSKIYAFPNPVREDFSGNVTITGLVRNTQVKITDVSGNLVYETVSDGGQATWDLQNYLGRHVSTGVYLVFCSEKDGSQSAVTKILVIR